MKNVSNGMVLMFVLGFKSLPICFMFILGFKLVHFVLNVLIWSKNVCNICI